MSHNIPYVNSKAFHTNSNHFKSQTLFEEFSMRTTYKKRMILRAEVTFTRIRTTVKDQTGWSDRGLGCFWGFYIVIWTSSLHQNGEFLK